MNADSSLMNPLDAIRVLRPAGGVLLDQAILHGELARVEWAQEKERLLKMLASTLVGYMCLLCTLLFAGSLVNSGPHSPEEIAKIYAGLRKQFPHAQVTAANLSEIAAAVEPYRNHLPVVTQEIGDTWIYGVASDPIKVARYREIARLRQDWLTQGKFQVGDSTDRGLLRRLALCASTPGASIPRP